MYVEAYCQCDSLASDIAPFKLNTPLQFPFIYPISNSLNERLKDSVLVTISIVTIATKNCLSNPP